MPIRSNDEKKRTSFYFALGDFILTMALIFLEQKIFLMFAILNLSSV